MIEHLCRELASNGSVRFAVRVRPNASQTRITGVLQDGSVKVDVAAPPEGGKANAALMRCLADVFNVPRASVHLLAGAAGRHKRVHIVQ